MTNADKIRQMTDEELANYLDSIHFQGILVGRKEIDAVHVNVFEWLEWLKEEVKEVKNEST